jgi:hypothetical protein
LSARASGGEKFYVTLSLINITKNKKQEKHTTQHKHNPKKTLPTIPSRYQILKTLPLSASRYPLAINQKKTRQPSTSNDFISIHMLLHFSKKNIHKKKKKKKNGSAVPCCTLR